MPAPEAIAPLAAEPAALDVSPPPADAADRDQRHRGRRGPLQGLAAGVGFALYLHFRSKEDIVRSLAQRYVDDALRELFAAPRVLRLEPEAAATRRNAAFTRVTKRFASMGLRM